jgi:hypothetical protein
MKNSTLPVVLALLLPLTISLGCSSDAAPQPDETAVDRLNSLANPSPLGSRHPLVGGWGAKDSGGSIFGLVFGDQGTVFVVDYVALGSGAGLELQEGYFLANEQWLSLSIDKSTCAARTPNGERVKFRYQIQGARLHLRSDTGIEVDLIRDALPTLTNPQVGCIDNGRFSRSS